MTGVGIPTPNGEVYITILAEHGNLRRLERASNPQPERAFTDAQVILARFATAFGAPVMPIRRPGLMERLRARVARWIAPASGAADV